MMSSIVSDYFTSSVTHCTHQCQCVCACVFFCLTRASASHMSKPSVKSFDIDEINKGMNDCVSFHLYLLTGPNMVVTCGEAQFTGIYEVGIKIQTQTRHSMSQHKM